MSDEAEVLAAFEEFVEIKNEPETQVWETAVEIGAEESWEINDGSSTSKESEGT